ncbi:hypothetical protein [Chroococcidiopsis sp. SAG 2025]|uniref:hypothetical protein n=1 Tax=Chroococcidiopsis sp. SAG 2025 TaxID=171389 RepID=UPI00293734F2|nr:hypothetical protein [Chroococcidiopsis sp. SAG 2025]
MPASSKKWRKVFADTAELVIAFECLKLGLRVVDSLDEVRASIFRLKQNQKYNFICDTRFSKLGVLSRGETGGRKELHIDCPIGEW